MAAIPMADLQSELVLDSPPTQEQHSPWVSTLKLLAKICDITSENSENLVLLIGFLELQRGDYLGAINIAGNGFDGERAGDRLNRVDCETWCHYDDVMSV